MPVVDSNQGIQINVADLKEMIQQVVFASSSRVQDDDAALVRGYLALLKAVGLVTLPVFFGAAVVAGSVIEGLYGARWSAAAPVFIKSLLAPGPKAGVCSPPYIFTGSAPLP